jgi:outer membrane lipoprotein SlyB
MLRNLMLTAGAVASLATAVAVGPASAHPHHHRVYHYRHGCHVQSHRSGAIGAVAGAIGGGIIGSAITHGNGPSTLLGAGAGALAGHAIGKSSARC